MTVHHAYNRSNTITMTIIIITATRNWLITLVFLKQHVYYYTDISIKLCIIINIVVDLPCSTGKVLKMPTYIDVPWHIGSQQFRTNRTALNSTTSMAFRL